MGKIAVYYAVNNSKKFLHFAKVSIESLRKHDKNVDVWLFVFGPPNQAQISYAAKLKVKVKVMPLVSKPKLTFLKWLALKELAGYERLLFADADTYFFASPKKLFSKYTKKDFYARREMATDPKIEIWSAMGSIYTSQIDHILYKKVAKKLRVPVLPIFNTGVMVFNRGLHSQISSHLKKFEDYRKQFKNGTLPYPNINRHITEEVCTSLVLGGVKRISCGFLEAKDSPWYMEWRQAKVVSRGILMHTGSSHFPAFYFDFFGKKALLKLLGEAY